MVWQLSMEKADNGYIISWLDDEEIPHSLLFEEQEQVLKELPANSHVVSMLHALLEFFAEEDMDKPSYQIVYEGTENED